MSFILTWGGLQEEGNENMKISQTERGSSPVVDFILDTIFLRSVLMWVVIVGVLFCEPHYLI